MPIAQAAIVRAVSVVGDSLGIFALAAGVHTSAQLAYTRSGWTSIQGFYKTQADPARELAALRPMQPKQSVSFCHNSALHNSGRGRLMERFLRGMQ
jgi:EAL domain-containing protein (putative c-di-GMP-specific phosphodiesterase class I)